MSLAIICIMDADRSEGESLSEEVLNALQDSGLPVVSAHMWNEDQASLGAMGALISTTVKSPMAPVPPPPTL